MKKNSANEINLKEIDKKVDLYALLNITKDADNDTIVNIPLPLEKSFQSFSLKSPPRQKPR